MPTHFSYDCMKRLPLLFLLFFLSCSGKVLEDHKHGQEVTFTETEILEQLDLAFNEIPGSYFPAGQRSIDGSVQPFKKGIGILIKELDVPVVPDYIEGSFKTWPRGRRFPRLASVSVRFGKALHPADFEIITPGEDRDPHQHIADQLREQVRALVRGPAAPPSSS